MTEIRDYVALALLFLNTVSLAVVLFKLVWGSSADLQTQFATLGREITAGHSNLRNEWQGKFDAHTSNFANVVSNLNDRVHAIELAAAKYRGDVAETYMRRDSYYRSTEEFKRDVRVAHDDLKKEMNEGFGKLETQVADLNRVILGQAPRPRGGA